jgi:mono/diheme cytochrome c family protein
MNAMRTESVLDRVAHVMLKPAALTLAGLALLSLSLPARAEEVSITAGRELATARCSRCHAVGRTGDSPNPRSPRFRDLGADFPFAGLQEALMQGMIVGHPEMPIQHLSQGESSDLIAYLQTLQRRRGPRPANRTSPAL